MHMWNEPLPEPPLLHLWTTMSLLAMDKNQPKTSRRKVNNMSVLTRTFPTVSIVYTECPYT